MLDLADRISRAAVAALDLAPFDDRFARLSRQVLAGGASRFEKVISADEPIDLVVPVGLPHERLDYGALVVQQSQVGLLWRDAFGFDHARTATLRPGASYSAVDLGGETWTRFDLPADDGRLTFLIPPVSSTLLRTTLARSFRATPGAAAPLVTPAPDPEPAPVVMPDPPQPPAPPAAPVLEFGPAFEPASEPTPVSPATPVSQVTPTEPATRVMEEATPAGESSAADAPVAEAPASADSTVVAEPQVVEEPVAAEPNVSAEPVATVADVAVAPDLTSAAEPDLEATRIHSFTGDDSATRVHPLPDDLFRPEARQPAAQGPHATAHQTAAYQPTAHQPAGYQPATHQAPLAAVAPSAAVAAAGGSTISLRGFVLGFVGALAIGGIALAIRLLAG